MTGTRATPAGPSRSSTSAAPRGPTSGRSPAISARPSGPRAYLGALVRTASGPFTIDAATPLDDVRAAAAEGPERLAGLLLPIDAGLEALPEVVLDAAEVAAVARGQFVRTGEPPGGSLGDGPIRVRDEAGTLVGDRPLPRRPPRPRQGPRRRPGARSRPCLTAARSRSLGSTGWAGTTGRSSPSSACSTASTAATSTCSATSTCRPRRTAPARPSSRSTPTPTRCSLGAAPPLLLDPEERLRLLGAAGVEVVVIQHFDAALRATEYDAFLARITARTRLAGLADDAGRGVRPRPPRHARDGRRARRERGLRPRRPPAVHSRRPAVRSSDIRAAIAAGDLAEAERLLGRPHAVIGILDAPAGSRSRCRSRCRRPDRTASS